MFDTGAGRSHPELRGKYRLVAGTEPGTTEDTEGHGTGVAGVIAARRDGQGMHGVAYEATIASYTHFGDDGAYTRAMRWFGQNAVLVANHSWGSETELEALIGDGRPVEDLLERGFVDAALAYQSRGGVQVWAAGNGGRAHSTSVGLQAGLPYFRPELERSWLAVVSVDENGVHPSAGNDPEQWEANRCGRARDWCIAAPGDRVYTTWNGPEYVLGKGSSFAAPHVSGALAVLKSLFPNLGYQQLRTRVLETADSSGRYADESVYGQGLLDLGAASRPVAGTHLALGAYDTDAVATTDGAHVALPRGAVRRHLSGRTLLVLDGFQRAPFAVRADAFAHSPRARLSLDDLRLHPTARADYAHDDGTVIRTIARPGLHARGVSDGTYLFGAAEGTRATEGVAELIGTTAPHGRHRMAPGAVAVATGLSLAGGTLYASAATSASATAAAPPAPGITGWAPRTVLGASFVPAQDTAQTFGAALATGLRRPMGVGGAGPFALAGESLELGWGRTLSEDARYRLGASARVARVSTERGALVSADDATLGVAEIDLSLRPAPSTTLHVRLGAERALGAGAGVSIRTATDIDETGRLTIEEIAVDGADLMRLDRIAAGVAHEHSERVELRASAMAVRDGYGETDAIVGVRARIGF